MPGLVPGIHVFRAAAKTWMAGTSPAMTAIWRELAALCAAPRPGHGRYFWSALASVGAATSFGAPSLASTGAICSGLFERWRLAA